MDRNDSPAIPNKPQPAVESRQYFIDVGGRTVAVRKIRPPRSPGEDGPTLVFLHEALGCIAMWKDVPARLSVMTGLPALVYDRHGHGLSGPLVVPRDTAYLDRESFEVLPAVLDACGVTDPILVGHSDGGSIALLYASRFPVRAVITEAAHVFVEDVTLAGIREAVEAWRKTDLRDRLARYHGDKTELLFFAWADTWLSEAFASWNIEDCLAGISSPLLVVQGEGDEYGTLRQVDAIVNGAPGRARALVLSGCRHIPHLQAAERLLPLMAAFIDDCRD